ncbi:DoxX family protein [Methylobacterium fujisawaense]|uniref:DoxX family protein n=1 Tax=Methylobacterium fujisawaense TaxID=107400 RepID=UPI002F35FF15
MTLKIMLALMALVTATLQVIGLPMVVAEFDLVAFGQWFRYVTALILVAGAFLMLRSATTALGALLLCTVCVGAFAAHRLILHGDLIHTIIPAVLLGIIAWTHRHPLPD